MCRSVRLQPDRRYSRTEGDRNSRPFRATGQRRSAVKKASKPPGDRAFIRINLRRFKAGHGDRRKSQPSAISHQPSPSAISHQPSAISHQKKNPTTECTEHTENLQKSASRNTLPTRSTQRSQRLPAINDKQGATTCLVRLQPDRDRLRRSSHDQTTPAAVDSISRRDRAELAEGERV